MGRIYKTARGRSLDMASLIAKQEKTRAVSNINSINSRGDEIDQAGNVVKTQYSKSCGCIRITSRAHKVQ